jgi:cysteine synthase
MKYHSTISNTIGSTPLVRLNRLNEEIDAEIFAKLEFFNPLGSVRWEVLRTGLPLP